MCDVCGMGDSTDSNQVRARQQVCQSRVSGRRVGATTVYHGDRCPSLAPRGWLGHAAVLATHAFDCVLSDCVPGHRATRSCSATAATRRSTSSARAFSKCRRATGSAASVREHREQHHRRAHRQARASSRSWRGRRKTRAWRSVPCAARAAPRAATRCVRHSRPVKPSTTIARHLWALFFALDSQLRRCHSPVHSLLLRLAAGPLRA